MPTKNSDQVIVTLWNTLLASLSGDYDRVPEMEIALQPSDIPDDLKMQKRVLDVIQECSKRQIKPNRENIIHGLSSLYGQQNQRSVEQEVDTILAFKPDDGGDVNSLTVWIFDDVKLRRGQIAIEEAMNIVNSNVGNVGDRLKEATARVSSLDVLSTDGSTVKLNQDQFADYADDLMARRARERKSGRAAGPSLKWAGFVDQPGKPGTGAIPYLKYGRTTLITVRTGGGKTLVGGILGEFNAWHEGIDVLYLHNETEPDTMVDRMISRNVLIPSDYLGAGLLDVTNPEDPIAKKYFDFMKWVRSPKKSFDKGKTFCDAGELNYVYCPGWNVFQIATCIRLARLRADQRNRGLLVIMDYYNIIDRSMFAKGGTRESSQMGLVAYYLRESIKVENSLSHKAGGVGVHCVVFAQETGEKDAASAYGSREIQHYSQLHLTLIREMATTDIRMEEKKDDPNYNKDALGNPRFPQRKGGWASKAVFKTLKANDNQRCEVEVFIDNQFFNIGDARK